MLTQGTIASSALLTTIRPLILAQGWTEPTTGRFVSPTVSGKTIDFTISAIVAQGCTISWMTKTYYINHGTTSTSGQVWYSLSVSTEHIFLTVRSAQPGTLGAPGTTVLSSWGIFPLIPYYAGDTEVADHLVAVGSEANNASPQSPNAHIRNGASSSTLAGRLFTMRPAIQDTVSTGDSLMTPEGSALRTFWPFVFVDNTNGIRGRLNYVAMGSEGYKLDGDARTAENLRVTIGGNVHSAQIPFRANSAGCYSPWGLAGTVGGPVIMVRE